jgi:hypothetical protein
MVKNTARKYKPLIRTFVNEEGLPKEAEDIMTVLISNESGGQLINPKTGVIHLRFEGHIFQQKMVELKANELMRQGVAPDKAMKAAQDYVLSLKNSDKNALFYDKVDQHPGTSGQAELNRLKKAYELNPEAAAMATGLGLTAIQGVNYKLLGFNTGKELLDYVLSNPKDEDFIRWQARIIKNNIDYFKSKYKRNPTEEEIVAMYQAGPGNPNLYQDKGNKIAQDYIEKYRRRKAYISGY